MDGLYPRSYQYFSGRLMKSRSQSGAQILEFALLLPIFLLIIFLVIDFGFLVYNKAIITNASREAAREGTVLSATPWSASAVAAVACNYARNSLISTRSGTHTATCSGTADPVIVVCPSPSPQCTSSLPPNFGDPITVQVTFLYSGFLTSTSTMLLRVQPWTLTASTNMNHE
jgi:Flp pilus assembly protein TadG